MNNHANESSAILAEAPEEPDSIKDRVFALGLIYLEAGLSADAALRSALADYECGFQRPELCLL